MIYWAAIIEHWRLTTKTKKSSTALDQSSGHHSLPTDFIFSEVIEKEWLLNQSSARENREGAKRKPECTFCIVASMDLHQLISNTIVHRSLNNNRAINQECTRARHHMQTHAERSARHTRIDFDLDAAAWRETVANMVLRCTDIISPSDTCLQRNAHVMPYYNMPARAGC